LIRLRRSRVAVFWGVWVVAAAVAVAIYLRFTNPGGVAGIAEVVETRVSSTEPARVLAVPVSPGQPVQKGDVVAVLDPEVVSRELEVLARELAQKEAELAARAAFLGRTRLSQGAVFEAQVDRTELLLLQARIARERDQADLDATRARMQWWKAQVDARVASSQTLDDLKVQAETLERRVALGARQVAALTAELETARERLRSWRAAGSNPNPVDGEDPEVAPLRNAVEVARARLALLQARREALVLRALEPGVVHRVLLQPGDVATPGSPVVVIRSRTPRRVLAYLTDVQAAQVAPGTKALVMPRDGSGRSLEGRVTASDGGMVPLPGPLQSPWNPAAWAREVVIALDDAASNLVPGQVVTVAFRTAPDAGPAIETVHAAETGPDSATSAGPAPILVPNALRERTRFEPSGLAWVAERSRFLVASDDTGWPGREDHAPWLFWMDRNGVVAPDPVVIEGIPELNDVESLTRRADGSLFAMCSQSVSRRGHRPRSRTLLIRMRLDGDRLVATGAASLAEAIAASGGPEFWERLGLVERDARVRARFDRVLNLEGLAADGEDLLLGVKQPMAADGRLVIWRLSQADRFIETGRLPEGALSVFARVEIDRASEVPSARAGISDLLRLPDGGLLILAVFLDASGVLPWGGAVLHVAAPVDSPGPRARLLRAFPGLKPEGVAWVPPDGLFMVFDRDRETPLFLRIPFPD